MKRKSRKAFHIIVFTKYVFFTSCFGEGLQPRQPPSLFWVRHCRPDIKPCTVVQPTYQRLNQRANGDAKFAADTRLEFQATIKLRESSEVKYREVSTKCWRVVKFTSRLLYPRESTPVASLSWFGRFEEKSLLCPVPEFEPRSSCLLDTPTKISRSICSKDIYKFNLKTLSSKYCFHLIYSTEQV
jgi:hypothetical protein